MCMQTLPGFGPPITRLHSSTRGCGLRTRTHRRCGQEPAISLRARVDGAVLPPGVVQMRNRGAIEAIALAFRVGGYEHEAVHTASIPGCRLGPEAAGEGRVRPERS